MKLTRRDALFFGVGGATLLMSPPLGFSKELEGQFGIQLYTLREQMQSSVPQTLEKVSKLGIRKVEFAGYFDHSASETKRMLNKSGLKSPSTHIQLDDIRNNLEKTLDIASEIGHKHIVLAWLNEEERGSLDQYKGLADLFCKVGEASNSRGIEFSYHHHDFEFRKISGTLPYQLLLDRIPDNLMKMQMDVGWLWRVRQDPVSLINENPGRFSQCHIKDINSSGQSVGIGSGDVEFSNVLSLTATAGFKHFYFEIENPEGFQDLTKSVSFLKSFSF